MTFHSENQSSETLTAGKRLNLLLVEDNEGDRLLVREALSMTSLNLDIREAEDGETALKFFEEVAADCILLDYHLPDLEAELLLRQFQTCDKSAVIVLTGTSDEMLACDLMAAGAFDYLLKSELTPQKLGRSLRYAAARNRFMLREREHKRLLDAKNRELRKLYETANDFVENVSHEFRTPLTVIKEYASIIQDGLAGEVNDQQDEYLGIIVGRVEDLSSMVDDMLDISRIDAGQLSVARSDNRVEDIIGRYLPALERRAKSTGHSLRVSVAPGLPRVYCDGEKVGRILINLVSNALKFSPDGEIVTIRVRCKADCSEVVIEVADRGPGIPPSQVSEIFERFRQLDGNVRSSTKGFGLGLNIVKELVHLNMGSLSVESALGEGSIFGFSLPALDPEPLLNRYLDRLANFRAESAYLSLVELVAPPETSEEALDDIETLIQRNIRRADLLFRTGRGDWRLILACDRYDVPVFRDRLAKAMSEENRNRVMGKLPQLRAKAQGCWLVAEHREQLIARVARALSGVKARSQSRSGGPEVAVSQAQPKGQGPREPSGKALSTH